MMGLPWLLVLDEPTNGLDPAGIVELRQVIWQLPAEHSITVFVSSHLLGEVKQVATHVGIVGRGRLLFQGTPAALQRRTRERLTLEVDCPRSQSAFLQTLGGTLSEPPTVASA